MEKCIKLQGPFYRVVDDSGEDYLYSKTGPTPLDLSSKGGHWEKVEENFINLKLNDFDLKLLNVIETNFDPDRTYTEDDVLELLDRVLEEEVKLAQDGNQDYADEFGDLYDRIQDQFDNQD